MLEHKPLCFFDDLEEFDFNPDVPPQLTQQPENHIETPYEVEMCEETSASSRTIVTWVNRLIISDERVLKETLALRK
jgi:hypothetical protein